MHRIKHIYTRTQVGFTVSKIESTMTQERLNNLLTLRVFKDYTDSLDLVATANEFVRDSE